MKFLVKVTLPTENASAAMRDGSIMEKMQRIFNETKPEAAYFATENGRRTQYIVVNVDDAKPLPSIAEPWWLLFNADVDILPVFTLQDMESMGPVLEGLVKKFGHG